MLSGQAVMEPGHRYLVRFEGLNAAAASMAAQELRRGVLEIDPGIEASLARTDPGAMDGGSALVVALLETQAAVALVKGIFQWLARDPTSRISVTRPDGTVVVLDRLSRMSGAAAAEVAERLLAGGAGAPGQG